MVFEKLASLWESPPEGEDPGKKEIRDAVQLFPEVYKIDIGRAITFEKESFNDFVDKVFASAGRNGESQSMEDIKSWVNTYYQYIIVSRRSPHQLEVNFYRPDNIDTPSESFGVFVSQENGDVESWKRFVSQLLKARY